MYAVKRKLLMLILKQLHSMPLCLQWRDRETIEGQITYTEAHTAVRTI